MRRSSSLGLLATLVLSGCAAAQEAEPTPVGADDHSVGHIHGLGVDPADDTVYVATHHGLFHVDDSGEPRRVADRWQDTMAFTVVGAGHFLASGHPDPREDLPPHLGLIESRDAGETWQPLALEGEADFHILEQAGDTLYGFDATSGRLLVTADERTFEEVVRRPLLSLTVDPHAPNAVLAVTPETQLIRIDAATGDTEDLPGPALVLLDTTSLGQVVGIDVAGTIHVRGDAGQTWQARGTIDGPPAAFSTTDEAWYAATTDQVFRSDDDGASWEQVL